ncbi:hypothetical protein GCM10009116_19990 [Brevundimonas basaltis]|uniref:Uncharacterized protein n=1 Tax=Brevundimonas basaltis TaxID=472166 RepID=A0A7W8MH83_9CAUL|nr:hypothetical protein [Brevundimonas basaltis]MBB5291751.1 hypothetical protein [Brevundimonas basaltis]
MLFTFLVSAMAFQDAPIAYPETPQQFRDRRSGYVQGTLNVASGERATLRRNDDGTYDLIGVDRIEVQDVLPPMDRSRASVNHADAGTLRFGLHARQDIGSVLKVENGQSEGLAYSGFIVRYVGGQARGPDATSVCTVPPGMATYEHWPEPVMQVVIGGLRRSDDALPTCPPHVGSPPEDAADPLTAEGEHLGRLSTLFALCEPYYTVDLAVGRRLAEDFERRSDEAGWSVERRAGAYDRGRDLERAEIGIVMNATGVTPQQARRRLRDMYPRLKARCQYLSQQIPGAVSGVEAGDRRLDAAAGRYR